jgi:hypothetical protein
MAAPAAGQIVIDRVAAFGPIGQNQHRTVERSAFANLQSIGAPRSR